MFAQSATRFESICIYNNNKNNNNNNNINKELLIKRIFDTFSKDLGLPPRGKFTGGPLKANEKKLSMEERCSFVDYLRKLLRKLRSIHSESGSEGKLKYESDIMKRVFDTATDQAPPQRGKFLGNALSANLKFQ